MSLEFGKLNFSTSFNPTSAFPLDARCYFESLESAQAAAAIAEEAGSTNSIYFYGELVIVYESDDVSLYQITPAKDLKKLASTTASGDLAGDVATLQSQVAALQSSVSDLGDADTALSGRISTIEGKEASWDAKYDKPVDGIPATDLSAGVQASLSKADSALQSIADGSITNAMLDSDLQGKIAEAHTHTNKAILDEITAAFTTEDESKLDSLQNYVLPQATDSALGGIKASAKGEEDSTYTVVVKIDSSTGLLYVPSVQDTDTNTMYQIVSNGTNSFKLQSKEINGQWEDVAGSTFTVNFDDVNSSISAVEQKAEAAQSAVNTLSETVSTLSGKVDSNTSEIALKQPITDETLTTTSKTVPGAINELKGSIDSIQTQVGENESSITSLTSRVSTNEGNISSLQTNVSSLTSSKQDKSDETLATTDKTVVGAINELNTKVTSISGQLSSMITYEVIE